MKKKIVLLILTVIFCNSLCACGGGSRSLSGLGGYRSSSKNTYTEFAAEEGLIYNSLNIPDAGNFQSMVPVGEQPDFNTEEYNNIERNDFKSVAMSPLSTFALDVDTGSYPNLRRMLNDGYLLTEVPSGAIRTEEMLNYFEFNFGNTVNGDKFDITYEISECPWNEENLIAALTVGTKQLTDEKGTSNRRNFVILFDTSGSMDTDDKGGLAIESLNMLMDSITKDDVVSIVTYAGDQATIIEGSNNKTKLKAALRNVALRLLEGGGTNGSGGIEVAYELASKYYIEGGNNRVILFSDGDMNLGLTSQSDLVDLVERNAKETGVFLTTLGFGSGNYSDANMEQIANKGNGNYYYIDCKNEAERVLINKLDQATLTVAKDVKIQVEFNPAVVKEYKLLGYENRALEDEDFEDDTKDGGETGPGQVVTVLYEIVPSNGEVYTHKLKYQEQVEINKDNLDTSEIMTMSIRYKEPEGDTSTLEQYPINFSVSSNPSKDFYFACGLAELVTAIDTDEVNEHSESMGFLLKAGSDDSEEREELLDLLELWL